MLVKVLLALREKQRRIKCRHGLEACGLVVPAAVVIEPTGTNVFRDADLGGSLMSERRCFLLLCLVVMTLPMLTAPGLAVTRDPPTGAKAVRDCVGQPCADGCWCPFNHWQEARLLKYGYGMTANREAAAYWYRRAAEKGDARAAFNYGFMLIHGIGADAEPEEGLRLVEKAAAASIREAWFELGNLHRLGHHLAADTHAAIKAYRRAADRGHVRAQHALANMYGNGQGVGIDLVTAYKWWRLAARKGHELAGQSLSLATSMMTPAEISLGKRAAAAWMATMRNR